MSSPNKPTTTQLKSASLQGTIPVRSRQHRIQISRTSSEKLLTPYNSQHGSEETIRSSSVGPAPYRHRIPHSNKYSVYPRKDSDSSHSSSPSSKLLSPPPQHRGQMIRSSSVRLESGNQHRSNRKKQHTKKITFAPKKLGPYKITKEIGKGAFGRVYKCFDIRTLRVFAIKIIKTRNMSSQQKKNIKSEVEILASLPPHENIVRYIETVQNSSFFGIVLEYVDSGSLQSFIGEFDAELTEQNVARFIIQILSGLHFLHQQGVIHRDIKAANVLITNEGRVKLTDFGIAIKTNCSDYAENNIEEKVAGSPYWMAPEIIKMKELTPACDIWAVGATAIELFTGHPPYHNLQSHSALYHIVNDSHPEIPGKVSNLFKEFLYQCFCKDPAYRPSAIGLKSHKWLINMMHDNNSMYHEATEKYVGVHVKKEDGNDTDLESDEQKFDKLKNELDEMKKKLQNVQNENTKLKVSLQSENIYIEEFKSVPLEKCNNITDSATTFSRKVLVKLSKQQLIKKCKAHRITTKGSKSDMIDRLMTKKQSKNIKKNKSKKKKKDKKSMDEINGMSIDEEIVAKKIEECKRKEIESSTNKKQSILLLNSKTQLALDVESDTESY